MPLGPDLRRELLWRASLALFETHRKTLKRDRNASEPLHVRYMTQVGSGLLFNYWDEILRPFGIGIRVTGVYCHQTPRAHFKMNSQMEKPELGDILFVHDHLYPTRRRRAILLQAKKGTQGLPSGSIDSIQRHLYLGWPDFELHGNNPLTGRKFLRGQRNIRSSAIGAAYCVIDESPVTAPAGRSLYPSVWRIASAATIGSSRGRNAAEVLTEMILGKSSAGRPAQIDIPRMHAVRRQDYIAGNRPRGLHWSITVKELLSITGRRDLPRASSGPITKFRGVTYDGIQHSSLQRVGGSDGGFVDEADPASPERDGVSLLHIETFGLALAEPEQWRPR